MERGQRRGGDVQSERQDTARRFYVADLNAQGELQLLAEYQYEQLERIERAADLIAHLATLVWREPEVFETPLPGTPAVSLRWRASAPTAGMATVRAHGALASLSLLASGLHPEADRITLRVFQQHLLAKLRDTEFEPAFDLMHLPERPLMATINFQSPAEPSDRLAVALADRCFAAAYFRCQGLT